MARYFTDNAPAVSPESAARSEIMECQVVDFDQMTEASKICGEAIAAAVLFICFAVVINDTRCAGKYLTLLGNQVVMLLPGVVRQRLICVSYLKICFFEKYLFFVL